MHEPHLASWRNDERGRVGEGTFVNASWASRWDDPSQTVSTMSPVGVTMPSGGDCSSGSEDGTWCSIECAARRERVLKFALKLLVLCLLL